MIPVPSSANRHLNLSMIFLETMLIPGHKTYLGHAYAPDTNWLAAADVYSWCRYCFLLQSFQLSIICIVNPFLTLLIYFFAFYWKNLSQHQPLPQEHKVRGKVHIIIVLSYCIII